MELADGYDTVIGERGVTLSGGQRQRLAIARALLTDPRILILDDSTSAIDSATEDEIQRAIRRILEGRTTLLITHRLSQIRWADKVLLHPARRAGRPGHARRAAGALRALPPDLRALRRGHPAPAADLSTDGHPDGDTRLAAPVPAYDGEEH